MYGMQPGIKMFTENVTFTATIMILMLLANVVFLIFGLATAKISAKVLNVSQPTVWTAVCILCVVGSFALNNTFFDVGVMFAAGVLGFFLKVFKFPNGPFVLGLLLGSMLESNMRRALAYFRAHGIATREEFKNVNAKGELVAVYLEEEVGGFAVHIVKKS